MQGIQQKFADDNLRTMHIVMGKPPCSYAVAGKGSLARKEITSYSLVPTSVHEQVKDVFFWFFLLIFL